MINGEVNFIYFLVATDVDGLEFGNPGVRICEEVSCVPDVDTVAELCGKM